MFDIGLFLEKWGLTPPFTEIKIESIFKKGNSIILEFNKPLKEEYEKVFKQPFTIPVHQGCSFCVSKLLTKLYDHASNNNSGKERRRVRNSSSGKLPKK